jgi:hypothetical protein
MAHQYGVDPVIEKTVYLNNIAGENAPLFADTIFQFLHDDPPASGGLDFLLVHPLSMIFLLFATGKR